MQHQIFTIPIRLLNDSLAELNRNDPLRMAAATAFFTTFALPPILLIIIQVLGLVFDPNKISRRMFVQLAEIIGSDSTKQVVDTLAAIRQMALNWYVTVGGFLFLVFVATTLFKVIRSSINQVWKIKVINKQGLRSTLRNRLKAVAVILIAGLLFVTGVVLEGVQAFLGGYIGRFSPQVAHYFNSVLSYVLSIFIVTIWFAIVFRYLPSGRPAWKVALAGALFTSVLFNIGKLVVRWLLSYSNINTFYGASGSIVLLLLFVFYSSLILYLGAAFTKVWSEYKKMPIQPMPHAMKYRLTEVGV